MADYVALEDDGPLPVVSPSLLPPPAPSSLSIPVSIPDDPSMIPHTSPPLHPHLLFNRLLSFSSRPGCNKAVFFLYPGFLLFLSTFMLAVGLSERQVGAPSPQSQLALWLIVASLLVSLLSLQLLVILASLMSPSCGQRSPLVLPLLLCLLLVHLALTFCWFIVGNVWFSLAPASTSKRLTRTVFWLLLFVYGQLLLQPVVSLVDWGVKKGCPCIKRSESAAREEDERRRALGGWAQGINQGGAQFI